MFVIIASLTAAVVIGVFLNVRFKDKDKDDEPKKQGAAVHEILGATALLAALLIAIVLSGAGASYSAARAAASQEANALDNLYESAEYLEQPGRQAVHNAAVCYARAVMGPEWEAMATSLPITPPPTMPSCPVTSAAGRAEPAATPRLPDQLESATHRGAPARCSGCRASSIREDGRDYSRDNVIT